MHSGDNSDIVAVGDSGRITVHEWGELAPVTNADLLTVQGGYQRFVAAGDDGVLVLGNAAPGHEVCAPITDEPIAALTFDSMLPDGVFGITASGKVFHLDKLDSDPTSCWTGDVLSGTILDAHYVCDDFDGYALLLTDEMLEVKPIFCISD
jgi:hypothetical protein